MGKKIMRYPATVSFRTTDELKLQLEKQAEQENKSVSEVLQAVVKKGLMEEETDYIMLVMELARLRGWDKKRIQGKIKAHKDNMAHALPENYVFYKKHAIQDIKDEIQICLEIGRKTKA